MQHQYIEQLKLISICILIVLKFYLKAIVRKLFFDKDVENKGKIGFLKSLWL
jgi:hypothetical protein